jgi:tetratricopeptide (TPR) repeat protein
MKYTTLLFWLFASSVVTAQSEFPTFTYVNDKDTLIFNKALELYDSNRYSEALIELDKLPKRHYGQESGSWYWKGKCFSMLDQLDKAVEAYSIALRSEPEAVGIYYNRGNSFYYGQKYKAALSDFAAYAIHFPQDVDAAINIALCFNKLDRVDEAIQYLENFEPKDTTLYLKLAYLYTDRKENHLKGVEMLEKALAINPTYADAIEDLSITYSNLEDYDKAFKLINNLIKLKPDYGRAYYLRGAYEEETDREDLAEVSFKIAREKGYTWDEEEYYEGEDDDN